MARLRTNLTFANVTSVLALFVALGGTSYAALKITGRNVKDGSLTGKDIKNNSVTTADIQNGSLLANDFKYGQLPAGPAGATGAKGEQGPTGPKGPTGDQAPALASGTLTKILYEADSGEASTTVYENPSFKLTASCASDGPTVVLRPKLDHGAYALAASSLNTTQALYSNNSDTSTTGPSAVRFFTNPEEAGTLTYVAPAGGSVTTITYTLNSLFAGRDCVFAGNAVTL